MAPSSWVSTSSTDGGVRPTEGLDRRPVTVVSTSSTDGGARPTEGLDRRPAGTTKPARWNRAGLLLSVCSGAIAADQPLGVRELAAVVHQEAAHAGELVLLAGHHLDGEFLMGQVGTRQLEGLGRLGLVLVDLAGVLVVPTRLELFDALFGLVFLVLARCVVVSRHSWCSLSPTRTCAGAELCTMPSGSALSGRDVSHEQCPGHCYSPCRSPGWSPCQAPAPGPSPPTKPASTTAARKSSNPSRGAPISTRFPALERVTSSTPPASATISPAAAWSQMWAPSST